MLTPKINRRIGLIDVGADLKIWVDTSAIANYLDYPIDEVKKKLDFGEQLEINDVPQWIENLNQLFSTKK